MLNATGSESAAVGVGAIEAASLGLGLNFKGQLWGPAGAARRRWAPIPRRGRGPADSDGPTSKVTVAPGKASGGGTLGGMLCPRAGCPPTQ